jgi:hypothetical protein
MTQAKENASKERGKTQGKIRKMQVHPMLVLNLMCVD